MARDESDRWDPDELSKDDVLELLARTRRRRVLHALLDADGETLSKTELVAELTTQEEGRRPPTGEDDERGDIETSLHHHHLPRLAAFAVVDYDRETGRVTPGRTISDVVPLLRFVGETE